MLFMLEEQATRGLDDNMICERHEFRSQMIGS